MPMKGDTAGEKHSHVSPAGLTQILREQAHAGSFLAKQLSIFYGTQ